ncbi:family 20 glycosylhydrolase [Maribacter sp. X9]|uniref:glycoside hydrolase family 20 protein n=1 Tax=Maribacter sp. X9 TaxID=3402159 RepID=UPI003AF3CBBD
MISIIPKPTSINEGQGYFEFDAHTVIVAKQEKFKSITSILTTRFQRAARWTLTNAIERPSDNYVELVLDTAQASEAYKLSVKKENITIEASDLNGFIYGLETIRMLLPVEIESDTLISKFKWSVPVMEIEDGPRFKWRGLMLDVSRHFFDIDYIKKTLDRMALLKLNTFHWHLIDDQGWRIEIKKYPRLTEMGAFRVDQEDKHWNARDVPHEGEKATYGGYYTHDDIKEVVDYAKNLGITVVPEIEMPAHVMSAIASYPELSCFETPIMVPSGGVWPITEIYCAGKESTFTFLEDVIDEVVQLFPSHFIHIGGDEATKTNWESCPHCKKRMLDEGLKNVDQLQSYFIERMEKYIASKGREVIGWDEILEGGIAPGAAVMSWRGVEGGMDASEQGHNVVMTPGNFCYFDKYQGPQNSEPLAFGGYLPLSKVYEFDPIIEVMTPEQAELILGGQANLWSEYVTTNSHSEYMLYPRLAALSEVLWSKKKGRSWNDFSIRVKALFGRLEQMGVNYSQSAYAIRDSATMDLDSLSISVSLKNEFEGSDIRFSTQKGMKLESFEKYRSAINLSESTTVNAVVFNGEQTIGPKFQKKYEFHKAVGKAVKYNTMYNQSYTGIGETTLVNVLRGSKDFHDGQWQAWLNDDIDITIDLLELQDVEKVVLGFLQNQGPSIYFPRELQVSISKDNVNFSERIVKYIPYESVNGDEIRNFEIKFQKQKARYIRIIAKNGPYGVNKNGSWLFMDEVLVE